MHIWRRPTPQALSLCINQVRNYSLFPHLGAGLKRLQRAARLGMRIASMEGSAGTRSAFKRASSTTRRSDVAGDFAASQFRTPKIEVEIGRMRLLSRDKKIWKKIQKNLEKSKRAS